MRRAFLAMVCAVVVGCGGGGEDSPPEKCAAFFDAYCAKFAVCQTGISVAQCKALVATQNDCSQVVAVRASYDACMSDLHASPCNVFFAKTTPTVPAACQNVLLSR